MEQYIPKDARYSVSLRTIYWIAVSITLFMSIVLLVATYSSTSSYNEINTAMENYTTLQNSANNMQAASDYLTSMVRLFTVTGDETYANNYQIEVNNTKRRENALNALKGMEVDTTLTQYLNSAMDASQNLENTEYYAMRLVMEACDIDVSKYPRVQAVELSERTKALPAAKKKELALESVFGKQYQELKHDVDQNTSYYTKQLMNSVNSLRIQSGKDYAVLQSFERVSAVILVLLLLSSFILLYLKVILPLLRGAQSIYRKEKIPLNGAKEMQLLAVNYNRMYDENKTKQAELSWHANHDALTRANNRAVFEKMLNEPQPGKDIVLLMIDVDQFKSINDTYGHNIGDQVLRKIVSLLAAQFRTDDFVCRIGGDEFVVIANNVTREFRPALENKLRYIVDQLQNPSDDEQIPATTLSMGVAFGKSENLKQLYLNADSVMYEVKENGRNAIKFFEE